MSDYIIPILLSALITVVGFFGGILINSLKKSVTDLEQAHSEDKRKIYSKIECVQSAIDVVVDKSACGDEKIKNEVSSQFSSLRDEIIAQNENFTKEMRDRVGEMYDVINPVSIKVGETSVEVKNTGTNITEINNRLNLIETEFKRNDKNIADIIRMGITQSMQQYFLHSPDNTR